MIAKNLIKCVLLSKQIMGIDLIGHQSDDIKTKTDINPIVNRQNSTTKRIDDLRRSNHQNKMTTTSNQCQPSNKP